MAEGPALKLVHWILTFGPMALSNQPLDLPTMACACVMFGNAPTRTVVTSWAHPVIDKVRHNMNSKTRPLITLVTSNYHGEDAGGFLFLKFAVLAKLGGARAGIRDQVG